MKKPRKRGAFLRRGIGSPLDLTGDAGEDAEDAEEQLDLDVRGAPLSRAAARRGI